MKTLHTFSIMTWQEQVDSIWSEGILLLTRRVPGYWLHLYAVGPFFAELWICQKRYEVGLVRAFLDTSELEPYLLQIHIDKLLSI